MLPRPMEFQSAVLRRRMVRHFGPEPVSPEIVNRMLSLAQHAPSAGFSQGCAYVVVTSDEMRKKIAALQGEQEYAKAGFHRWISEAPVSIVACVSEKAYHDRYREPDKLNDDGTEIDWPTPYWFFDVGCASMIILLAAVDSGLAASLTGVFDVSGMKRLLGIPEDFHPVGVISIGYPREDVKSPSLKRGRRPLGQVVHHEHW
jgi:nitroreductase